MDGVIVSYDITPGQTVAAGTSIFTVADLSTVWGDLRIYQANFGQIREGQSVRISGGHNLPTYRGTIDYVAPTVDEETRTGLARIVMENPERAWKPGMFIQGAVAVDRAPRGTYGAAFGRSHHGKFSRGFRANRRRLRAAPHRNRTQRQRPTSKSCAA